MRGAWMQASPREGPDWSTEAHFATRRAAGPWLQSTEAKRVDRGSVIDNQDAVSFSARSLTNWFYSSIHLGCWTMVLERSSHTSFAPRAARGAESGPPVGPAPRPTRQASLASRPRSRPTLAPLLVAGAPSGSDEALRRATARAQRRLRKRVQPRCPPTSN